MFITLATMDGTTTVNTATITHLTEGLMGTQINFLSGQSILVEMAMGELTLELARASAQTKA